jgi:hypothetical protein
MRRATILVVDDDERLRDTLTILVGTRSRRAARARRHLRRILRSGTSISSSATCGCRVAAG